MMCTTRRWRSIRKSRSGGTPPSRSRPSSWPVRPCPLVLPFLLIVDSQLSRCTVVCCYTEKSGLPWWALIVALIFAILILPFYGAMYAISAVQLVITNLFQILGAALVPGSSQANMVRFRCSSVGVGLCSPNLGWCAVLRAVLEPGGSAGERDAERFEAWPVHQA